MCAAQPAASSSSRPGCAVKPSAVLSVTCADTLPPCSRGVFCPWRCHGVNYCSGKAAGVNELAPGCDAGWGGWFRPRLLLFSVFFGGKDSPIFSLLARTHAHSLMIRLSSNWKMKLVTALSAMHLVLSVRGILFTLTWIHLPDTVMESRLRCRRGYILLTASAGASGAVSTVQVNFQ